MKIIEPSFEILYGNEKGLEERIEQIGRVCYKSEDKITSISSRKFVDSIMDRKHLSVVEHISLTVRFIHNRGFTHELVRHRLAAYSQESTRYCNYSKDKFNNELTFIKPYWWEDESLPYIGGARTAWIQSMELAEKNYNNMIECGLKPQAARGILPNDLKTEIIMTANLREWIHVFKLRTSRDAHPDMIRVMVPLKFEFKRIFPTIFMYKREEINDY